jgi:hypothetical protein
MDTDNGGMFTRTSDRDDVPNEEAIVQARVATAAVHSTTSPVVLTLASLAVMVSLMIIAAAQNASVMAPFG